MVSFPKCVFEKNRQRVTLLQSTKNGKIALYQKMLGQSLFLLLPVPHLPGEGC